MIKEMSRTNRNSGVAEKTSVALEASELPYPSFSGDQEEDENKNISEHMGGTYLRYVPEIKCVPYSMYR